MLKVHKDTCVLMLEGQGKYLRFLHLDAQNFSECFPKNGNVNVIALLFSDLWHEDDTKASAAFIVDYRVLE